MKQLGVELDNHKYHWKEVVIGNSLASLVYAKKNGCKLIVNELEGIFQFDLFKNKETLRALNYDTMIANKKTLVDQILFDLCLDGHAPINQKVRAIRVEPENNTLSVIVADSTKIKIQYEKLRIFDDSLVSGLPFEVGQRTDINVVYDWFSSNINKDIHFLELYDEDSTLVKRVIIRKKPRNLVIAQSFLGDSQLKKFDFSDTMSRFRLEKILKQNDIKGPKNGFYKNKPTVPRYRPVKLDFIKREILPQKTKEFVKFGNITFDNEVV